MRAIAGANGGTQESVALERIASAAAWKQCTKQRTNALARPRANWLYVVKISAKLPFSTTKIASTPLRAAIHIARVPPLRKKIIGHAMRMLGERSSDRNGVRCGSGALALLHQPAGKHRASVFLEPLIQQRPNFLAQIGSVAQSGEFIALKGTP